MISFLLSKTICWVNFLRKMFFLERFFQKIVLENCRKEIFLIFFFFQKTQWAFEQKNFIRETRLAIWLGYTNDVNKSRIIITSIIEIKWFAHNKEQITNEHNFRHRHKHKTVCFCISLLLYFIWKKGFHKQELSRSFWQSSNAQNFLSKAKCDFLLRKVCCCCFLITKEDLKKLRHISCFFFLKIKHLLHLDHRLTKYPLYLTSKVFLNMLKSTMFKCF